MMNAEAIDRRSVLHGLAGAVVAPEAKADGLTGSAAFMALGDWGQDGQHHQKDVASAMALAAAEVGSRFVISAGDNFYPCGVRSASDPQWKSSFEDIYTAASLQTPWYAALGNHDYRSRPHAQVEYSRHSARWRMPHRYYRAPASTLGVAGMDLFVLDTTPFGGGMPERLEEALHGHVSMQNADRQVAWLQSELARSTAPLKIVVGHHPIHSGGRHGDTPELVARIKPLLQAYGVQAYICGHDHNLQHIRRDGVDYVCAGAGASAGAAFEIRGTRFCQSQPGFAMFALASGTLTLEFRDFAGRSLYATELAGVGA